MLKKLINVKYILYLIFYNKLYGLNLLIDVF